MMLKEKMALSHEKMWVNKLGLKQYDEELVLELVELMYQDKVDMTMFLGCYLLCQSLNYTN